MVASQYIVTLSLLGNSIRAGEIQFDFLITGGSRIRTWTMSWINRRKASLARRTQHLEL